MENRLKKNQELFFVGDKIPYEVKAVSERYAVCSRKLHRREDADLLHDMVKMDRYSSFTEAFEKNVSNPVYTIIDFEENINSPDNLIFGRFDYFIESDCEEAIKALENDEMELSYRSRVKLNIDWERTNKI